MSYQCVEAIEGQTCIRCGRQFNKNELIFLDEDGDPLCIEFCFRTRPAKPRKATPVYRTPVTLKKQARRPVLEPEYEVEIIATPSKSDGLLSDMLKEGIKDCIKEMKDGK